MDLKWCGNSRNHNPFCRSWLCGVTAHGGGDHASFVPCCHTKQLTTPSRFAPSTSTAFRVLPLWERAQDVILYVVTADTTDLRENQTFHYFLCWFAFPKEILSCLRLRRNIDWKRVVVSDLFPTSLAGRHHSPFNIRDGYLRAV